jgi:hypothetical protein
MNSKQFLKILIAVVVIGGIGIWLNQNRQGAWKAASQGGGDKVLGDFDVNEVAGLTIKTSDGELNVSKKGDVWVVKERGGYPARFSTVVDFIRKAADLKVVQQQQIGESAFARMEVNDPGSDKGAGTLVELKDTGGKALKALVLGKEVMKKPEENSPFGGTDFAVGRWVLNKAEPDSILTVSETFSDAKPDAKNWINKDFVKIAKLKTIAVTSPTNDFSWTVERETEGGEWKLAGLKKDEETDSSKLSAIGNPLSSPSFQDVVVDAKDDTTGFDKAVAVRLTTFEGFSYDLKIGKPTDDNDYHFKVSVDGRLADKREPGKDEKEEDKARLDQEFADNRKKLEAKLTDEKAFSAWTYLVSKWTVDSFFKKRSEFIAEKKVEEEIKLPDTPTPLLNPPKPAVPPGTTDAKKPKAPAVEKAVVPAPAKVEKEIKAEAKKIAPAPVKAPEAVPDKKAPESAEAKKGK